MFHLSALPPILFASKLTCTFGNQLSSHPANCPSLHAELAAVSSTSQAIILLLSWVLTSYHHGSVCLLLILHWGLLKQNSQKIHSFIFVPSGILELCYNYWMIGSHGIKVNLKWVIKRHNMFSKMTFQNASFAHNWMQEKSEYERKLEEDTKRKI